MLQNTIRVTSECPIK